MKIFPHTIVSTVSGISIFLITRSILLGIITFLSGIFIDIDHLLDYFFNEKKIKLNIKDFFYKCENLKLKKVTLIFHSYELLILLVLLLLTKYNVIVFGILLGFILHIFFDLIFNCGNLMTYSFIYRVIHKFEFKQIFNNKKITIKNNG